ncbi:hypothetical protein D4Q76_02950 [archaeon]|nr:MAG: hypothetical protein D4Q76_02950 [archaeon]
MNEKINHANIGDLRTDFENRMTEWSRYKNDYALWVLNPVFSYMKGIVDDEEQFSDRCRLYDSKNMLSFLSGMKKTLSEDADMKRVIESVRRITGDYYESEEAFILSPISREIKEIKKETESSGRFYSSSDAYERFLKIADGFKENRFFIDGLEILKKNYDISRAEQERKSKQTFFGKILEKLV